MLMRRLFGPTGAAMVALVALLGVHGGAHALKIVSASGEAPAGGMSSVTYAKETLLKGAANIQEATDTTDKTTYYKITRSHIVSGPADVTAAVGDGYIVSYRLEGMVFAGAATLAAVDDGTNAPTPASAGTFSLARGGSAGDNLAVFRLSSADGIIGGTNNTYLELSATFAISGEGSGSITRTVQNLAFANIPNVDSTKTHMAPGIIKAMPALKETVRPMVPAPIARVGHDFMAFGGPPANPMHRTSLGTLVVGVTSGYRDAQSATADIAALVDVDGTTEGITVGPTTTGADADATPNDVTFSGNFSFVKTLALATDCDAGTTLTEIRKPSESDPNVYTDETNPRDASTFVDDDASTENEVEGPMHLCIEVDGETAIPATEPYTVTTKYEGLASAAFPPMGGTHNLAMITRDGMSVDLPFLVAQGDRYRQRISIVNKNSRAVDYNFTFTPEMDTMVTAGDMASGMVPANMTLVLDSRDVATITGGPGRTAATLNLVASDSTVDVAVTLVNRHDGSTTVVHASE